MAKLSNNRSAERRYPRFQLDVRVRVTTAAHGDRAFLGRAIEISACGASALIPADIPTGEVVELGFVLHAVEMRLRAVVRNRLGARYGFEFLTLSAKQRQQIEDASQTLEIYGEN
jgi:hypothetical protein